MGEVGAEGLRRFGGNVHGDGVIGFALTITGVVEVAPQPPGRTERIAIGGGFPNFAGPKVTAVGVRVADVLHDRKLPLVEEVMHFRAGRM